MDLGIAEGGREGGREGGTEGRREGEREGAREGGREGGRESTKGLKIILINDYYTITPEQQTHRYRQQPCNKPCDNHMSIT